MVLLKKMIIVVMKIIDDDDDNVDDDVDDDDDNDEDVDDDVGGETTVGRHRGRFRIPERTPPLLTRLRRELNILVKIRFFWFWRGVDQEEICGQHLDNN